MIVQVKHIGYHYERQQNVMSKEAIAPLFPLDSPLNNWNDWNLQDWKIEKKNGQSFSSPAFSSPANSAIPRTADIHVPGPGRNPTVHRHWTPRTCPSCWCSMDSSSLSLSKETSLMIRPRSVESTATHDEIARDQRKLSVTNFNLNSLHVSLCVYVAA